MEESEGAHLRPLSSVCMSTFSNISCETTRQIEAKFHMVLVWFDFCFTALQHILGNFGRVQLVTLTTLPLGKPPRQFTDT